MTPKDKNKIRIEIKKRIEEEQNRIARLLEQKAHVRASVAIGSPTIMNYFQQKNTAESNLKSAEKVICRLQVVLSKLDEPDFGICAICKNSISEALIFAEPETKICVHCRV